MYTVQTTEQDQLVLITGMSSDNKTQKALEECSVHMRDSTIFTHTRTTTVCLQHCGGHTVVVLCSCVIFEQRSYYTYGQRSLVTTGGARKIMRRKTLGKHSQKVPSQPNTMVDVKKGGLFKTLQFQNTYRPVAVSELVVTVAVAAWYR